MNFPIENGKGRLIHLLRGYLAKPGDCVVARVGSGYLMQLDISEYIQRSIYFLGYYEAPFARWLHSCLRPGMVFCDVGANGYDIYRFPLGHGIRKLDTVSLDEAENSSMLVATKHGRAV